jgi:ferredoxin-NADP reductase
MMQGSKIRVEVGEVKEETPMVKSFKLLPLDGILPRFGGGAHIMTYLTIEGQTMERHYSLSNDPRETGFYRISIRRSETSRGGSVYWHDQVKVGQQLVISYPRNHFPLSFQAKHHVLLAAGIGITPFIGMMADLESSGKSFELHYAASSKEMCPFYDLIRTRYPEQSHFYFSQNQQRMATMTMWKQPIGTHVYFCGPENMVTQFSQAAINYGYPKKSIHFEFFSPPGSGPQHPFRVVLKKSNLTFDIPEGTSLLEVLLEKGINPSYSCRIGGCGSCEVEVEEGEVDHRDFFLSDQEKKARNVILTCVSRAKSDQIVLDL